MLNELSITIATVLTSLTSTSTYDKEKTLGFENTRIRITRIKDLIMSKIRSFIFDLLSVSTCEEKRKLTAEKLFFIPLFLDIRCKTMGRETVTRPIKKNGFKKEIFTSFPYCNYLAANKMVHDARFMIDESSILYPVSCIISQQFE